MTCPDCNSEKVIKYGKDESGRQRWLCHVCTRRFTADEINEDNPAAKRKLGAENSDMKKRIVELEDALYSRAEIDRGIERALKGRHEPFHLKSFEYANDSTVMLNISDVHLGCVVEGKKVLGINEYNSDIARERLSNLFSQTLAFGRFMKCRRLVINLLGDLVHGNIHKSNLDAGAPKSIIALYDILVDAVKGLSEWFGEIIIECVVGNHGRTDVKLESVNVAIDSFEYILYQFLKRGLADSGVVVNVPESQYKLCEYSGVRVLLLHGHNVKGGSGMVDFPAMGLVRNSNRMQGMLRLVGEDFDVAVMGHFHTFVNIPDNMNRRIIVNPAMMGGDEYAINALAKAYPPAQTVMLLNAGNLEIVKEIRL